MLQGRSQAPPPVECDTSEQAALAKFAELLKGDLTGLD